MVHTFDVRLLPDILLNIKCILSCTCSGGCAISLFSDAPSRVSILLALAMDGSLDLLPDKSVHEQIQSI